MGSGILGTKLKEKGCLVYGIDISKKALALAKKRVDKTILLDIEKDVPSLDKKFDVIIFADILEHLRDPEKVLKRYLQFLKPNGKIVVSLPNIANWSIRIKLLFGSFRYTETGILDKTHLHFYTLQTAKDFLRNSGITLQKIDITPSFARSLLGVLQSYAKIRGVKGGRKDQHEYLLKSPFYNFYRQGILPLETFISKIWKGLFAYQFILVGKAR